MPCWPAHRAQPPYPGHVWYRTPETGRMKCALTCSASGAGCAASRRSFAIIRFPRRRRDTALGAVTPPHMARRRPRVEVRNSGLLMMSSVHNNKSKPSRLAPNWYQIWCQEQNKFDAGLVQNASNRPAPHRHQICREAVAPRRDGLVGCHGPLPVAARPWRRVGTGCRHGVTTKKRC